MSQAGGRRKKQPRFLDILVIPTGEGGKTRKFRASALRLTLLGVAIFLLCVGITLAVLVYTPLAFYVPIPNPALEQKYGRQILETQQRLNALAEDVLLLRDYNQQLRKALGEGSSGDSTTVKGPAPSLQADESVSTISAPPPEETLPQHHGGDAGIDAGMAAFSGEVVGTGSESVPSFPLTVPTVGFVTQGFDPGHGHFGLDIAGKVGTVVCAAGEGTIVFSEWTFEDGNMVIMSHGGGYITVYKHNQALLKPAHVHAKRGEPIALLGTSGQTSLGPHLHFEVWKDGIPQDPNAYLLTPTRPQ